MVLISAMSVFYPSVYSPSCLPPSRSCPKGDSLGRTSTSPFPDTLSLLVQILPLYQCLFYSCTTLLYLAIKVVYLSSSDPYFHSSTLLFHKIFVSHMARPSQKYSISPIPPCHISLHLHMLPCHVTRTCLHGSHRPILNSMYPSQIAYFYNTYS